MMDVGRITFGPIVNPAPNAAASHWTGGVLTVKASETARACNCIGPQPGQKLCPCMLLAETAKGMRMVAEGVVINGVEYDLVPRPAASKISGG